MQKPPVLRITLVQVLLLASTFAAMLLLVDPTMAWSFLCGGLVNVVPGVYFARQVFQTRKTAVAEVTRAFYRGEVVRFVLTAVGFGMVFALLRPLNAVAVFAGFGVMWVVQLGGAFWLSGRKP